MEWVLERLVAIGRSGKACGWVWEFEVWIFELGSSVFLNFFKWFTRMKNDKSGGFE
jgi:hypothetical protein